MPARGLQKGCGRQVRCRVGRFDAKAVWRVDSKAVSWLRDNDEEAKQASILQASSAHRPCFGAARRVAGALPTYESCSY